MMFFRHFVIPQPAAKFWVLYRNHSVRPSVCMYMSCNSNSTLTDKLTVTKHSCSVVYDLSMCMKEDNLSLKYFKGDN